MTAPRPLFSIVAACMVLGLLGAGIYLRIDGGADGDGDAGAVVDSDFAPIDAFATDISIPVEGVGTLLDTLVLSVNAAGQAAAMRQSVILAQVAGRVQSVRVRENDAVGTAAALLGLDPSEYELGLADARAGVQAAEAAYRETTLFDDRIEDPRVREERDRVARAKSGVDRAQVQLRRAENDLDRTRVTAPFPGRVASIRVVPGQWVRAGDELMTIVDLDPIKVEVQVLESEIGFLSPGHRGRILFAAFPGETFEGRVESINPWVEQSTRTARVTVVVPNPGGRILPGMYARVALDARRFADRVLVPRVAVLERDRRTMLFVFEDGLAKWRYVTTGLANETMVEIVESEGTDSVRPGEIVLVGGHHTLIHDARVRLVDNVQQAGGRPN